MRKDNTQTSERPFPDAMNDQNSTRDVKPNTKIKNQYGKKRQQSG